MSYTYCITVSVLLVFFFFNDTATTEIYTLSLHDALPISLPPDAALILQTVATVLDGDPAPFKFASDPLMLGLLTAKNWPRSGGGKDRKSTRLNSSHANISYAVFCLKKKKKN